MMKVIRDLPLFIQHLHINDYELRLPATLAGLLTTVFASKQPIYTIDVKYVQEMVRKCTLLSVWLLNQHSNSSPM